MSCIVLLPCRSVDIQNCQKAILQHKCPVFVDGVSVAINT